MRYNYSLTSDNRAFVSWPGFEIQTVLGHGAAKLVEELNRLDTELVRTRQELESVKRDLVLQIEAKNNYISQAATFVTAIRESQKILASYLESPRTPSYRGMKQVITGLLEIIDHRDLITVVGGSTLGPEHIRRGSIKPAVEMSTLNDWENATHQITFDGKHWVNVELDGDCFTACSDGKRSWSVDSIPSSSVVQRPTPEAAIDYEVSPAILERVVNNTVNHFAPRRVSKKQRAALEDAIDLLNGSRFGPAENELIVYRLKRLLKKLS